MSMQLFFLVVFNYLDEYGAVIKTHLRQYQVDKKWEAQLLMNKVIVWNRGTHMLDFAITTLLLLLVLCTLENVPRIKMQTSKCLYFHTKWFILIWMFLSMKDTSQTWGRPCSSECFELLFCSHNLLGLHSLYRLCLIKLLLQF